MLVGLPQSPGQGVRAHQKFESTAFCSSECGVNHAASLFQMDHVLRFVSRQCVSRHILFKHAVAERIQAKKLRMTLQMSYERGEKGIYLGGPRTLLRPEMGFGFLHDREPTFQQKGCKDFFLRLEIQVNRSFGKICCRRDLGRCRQASIASRE